MVYGANVVVTNPTLDAAEARAAAANPARRAARCSAARRRDSRRAAARALHDADLRIFLLLPRAAAAKPFPHYPGACRRATSRSSGAAKPFDFQGREAALAGGQDLVGLRLAIRHATRRCSPFSSRTTSSGSTSNASRGARGRAWSFSASSSRCWRSGTSTASRSTATPSSTTTRRALREWLRHRDDFLAQCGPWLDAKLLDDRSDRTPRLRAPRIFAARQSARASPRRGEPDRESRLPRAVPAPAQHPRAQARARRDGSDERGLLPLPPGSRGGSARALPRDQARVAADAIAARLLPLLRGVLRGAARRGARHRGAVRGLSRRSLAQALRRGRRAAR